MFEGSATGAATDGVLGGIGGLLLSIGALAIRCIGPFIAADPIVATLTGAAVGAGYEWTKNNLLGYSSSLLRTEFIPRSTQRMKLFTLSLSIPV